MKSLIMGACASLMCAVGLTFPENTVSYTAPPPQKNEIQLIEVKASKPEALKNPKVGQEIEGRITMYNSVPEQTDDTPFHTASGKYVRQGIVANNCLPFGSKVIIAGAVYEVQDRMNSRYGCEYFDIWSESIPEARAYGVKSQLVLVMAEPEVR